MCDRCKNRDCYHDIHPKSGTVCLCKDCYEEWSKIANENMHMHTLTSVWEKFMNDKVWSIS